MYLPGKDLIRSRLPRQEWFTLDEAAAHSGWSRNFIRDRCVEGTLPHQAFQRAEAKQTGRRNHESYRIHVDDLVLFILRNGRKHYREEKPFRDVAMLVRSWPPWMQRELVKFVDQHLTPSTSDPRHS